MNIFTYFLAAYNIQIMHINVTGVTIIVNKIV